MAGRFLSRVRLKWLSVGGIIGGGAAAAAVVASSSSLRDDLCAVVKVTTAAPIRLFRDAFTAALIVLDYEMSLRGLPEGSPERLKVKQQVHSRSAIRLRDLCFHNGGIYIKLGQHLGQLEYVVPQEYVETMRASLLNKCPVSSYEQVCQVFLKELGQLPNQVFAEFDPVPLASASLAQVHEARTHNGEKVAVKVQHTHLTDTALVDTATVEFIVNFLNWCLPAFDYRWLVDEIRDSVPKELDFLYEAKNSEKCLENFRRLSPHLADYVYAPKVYWEHSTSKLLIMEFIDAAGVTDVNAIRRLGIHPIDVAKLVSQTFAEMIFKHGFVHCDPHAANMLVRPVPSAKTSILGKRRPQLVLLDHGLYKTLDFPTRANYAALWKALVFADVNGIKENSAKLGAGEDLYILFAGVLTMRPWKRVIERSVDHLHLEVDDTDRSEVQMYASQYFVQISELLRRLPRVILLMLKTNDCLRAVNHCLGSTLETFLIIGKVSSEAVAEIKMSQRKSLLGMLSIVLEEILLEARLLAWKFAIWILQFRKKSLLNS